MKNNLKIKIKNKSYQFKTYNKSNLKGLTWLPCKREWDPNINLHRLMRKKNDLLFLLEIGLWAGFLRDWAVSCNWDDLCICCSLGHYMELGTLPLDY
jgi:hypothetical protein